jgi:uncharacterized protein YndB with AHSA1/START domain
MAEDIDKTVRVAAPVDEVWRLWTTSEGIARFFASESRVEPVVGGAFEMYFLAEPDEVGRGSEGCTVLGVEPNRRLSFTWNAPPDVPTLRRSRARTEVDLTFDAAGEETVVRLHQHGLGDGPDWEAYRDYFDAAWEQVLSNLRGLFESSG